MDEGGSLSPRMSPESTLSSHDGDALSSHELQARYRARAMILGCGRLGSALTPLNRKQCIEFLHLSYELGVRDFDTASIYGQGDSERFIGQAFRDCRHQVRIASKSGQHLSMAQKAVSLFKTPIRMLATGRKSVRSSIATHRAKPLRFDFDAQRIRTGLESSLRRLGMERLDIFYLHSPPSEALKNDELLGMLERLRKQGKFSRLGISCDDPALVLEGLSWEPAQVVQFDLQDAPPGFGVQERDWSHGKTVLLRGAFRQGRPTIPAWRLHSISNQRDFGGFIVGTTNALNLRSNVDLVRTFYGAGSCPPKVRP